MGDWTFEKLGAQTLATLDNVLAEGKAPPFSSLVGWEFRGWNVHSSLAKQVMAAMGFQRFAKGFFLDDDSIVPDEAERIRGYNVMIKSGKITDPWNAKPSDEAPKRHSFYFGYAPGTGERTEDHDHAVFLNYNIPENGLFDGKGIRDYVVQVNAGDPDLLLGKAYFHLGPLTVVGGFFILDRWREYDYKASLKKSA